MNGKTLAGLLVASAFVTGYLASRRPGGEEPGTAGLLEPGNPPANAARDVVWAECEDLYDSASREELVHELSAVQASVRAITKPVYEDRFGLGQYDIEGEYEPGKPYTVALYPDLLSARRMLPNGLVAIVALRQQEFPEAYDLMYRGQWLTGRIRELDALASLRN